MPATRAAVSEPEPCSPLMVLAVAEVEADVPVALFVTVAVSVAIEAVKLPKLPRIFPLLTTKGARSSRQLPVVVFQPMQQLI